MHDAITYANRVILYANFIGPILIQDIPYSSKCLYL